MSNSRNGSPIDFVITWVDDTDSEWLEQKARWKKLEADTPWKEWTTGDKRFRDWGLLKYWFRAVEKYASWVNQIYFVTAGSIPEWLDADAPKLTVVKHEDFIPEKYLPTFNSHCIEWNLHRLPGLSEQFVYFNDDFYINAPLTSDFFFRNGLPKDYLALSVPKLHRKRTSYHVYSAMILNDHWDMHTQAKENPTKWFAPCYGPAIWARNLFLLSQKELPGFQCDHLPYCFLKSTFEKLWDIEHDELDKTCSDRFRGFYGITPNLARDWQRIEGSFVPRTTRHGKAFFDPDFYLNDENLDAVLRAIGNSEYKVLCINDEINVTEQYERWGEAIRSAFQGKLPNRSVYEKKSQHEE